MKMVDFFRGKPESFLMNIFNWVLNTPLFWFSIVGKTIQEQYYINKWDKVFKNGRNKICGRQPLKKFELIWSAEADLTTSNFLRSIGPFSNTLFQML